MVEEDPAGEILTTSPTDRSRDAWLQRTIANSGRNLSDLRDHLFEQAAVQRHHLVLDLNAASGLLTWEALRQAPEGGVWALTGDVQAGEALRQQATKLPELEQPVILIGQLGELDYLFTLRGEEAVQFDRIIGRNAFTRQEEWQTAFALLKDKLLPDGRLILAQTIPRLGQRLYKLVEWHTLPKTLAKKVETAEEAIYLDDNDPLVNWNGYDLVSGLETAGFSSVEMRLEKQLNRQRIGAGQLNRWFGEGDRDGERPSYKDRLAIAGLTAKEIARVEALYQQQLTEQIVDWETTVALVLALD
jgi:putative ATPase